MVAPFWGAGRRSVLALMVASTVAAPTAVEAQTDLGDPAVPLAPERTPFSEEPSDEPWGPPHTFLVAGAFVWPQLDFGTRTSFGVIEPGGGLEVAASFGLDALDGQLAIGPALGASVWQPRAILYDRVLGGLVDLDVHADVRVPLDGPALRLVCRFSIGGTLSVIESGVATTDYDWPSERVNVGGGVHTSARAAIEWLPGAVGLSVGLGGDYRHVWHFVEVTDMGAPVLPEPSVVELDVVQIVLEVGLVVRL